MAQKNKVNYTKEKRISLIITAITTLACLVAIILGIIIVQQKNTNRKLKSLCNETLSLVTESLNDNTKQVEELTARYHFTNQSGIDNVSVLYSTGRYDYVINHFSLDQKAEEFTEIQESLGTDFLYLINTDGDILLASNKEMIGNNVLSDNFITQDQLTSLTKCVEEDDQYYYGTAVISAKTNDLVSATALNFTSEEYKLGLNVYSYTIFHTSTDIQNINGYVAGKEFLVCAFDSSILETEYATLKDIGSILSSVTIGSDGFVFAVDSSTQKFLYFKDGETVLTNENITQHGLSLDSLKEGQSAVVTIEGKEYYIISKNYSSSVYGKCCVITASLNNGSIQSTNSNILYWTITLFLVIAILMSIYGGLLQDDYLKTVRVPLTKVLFKGKKTTIYFNKSIGKRISFASLIGLIIIFIGAFLLQTGFSLSDAVNNSISSMNQIANKFTNNEELDSEVKEYYTKQFISVDNALAYILEENVDYIFNYDDEDENTFIYTTFDKEGNKVAVNDKYGNPIHSSASNEYLQYLAGANSVKDIYIYDESGRTIATSSKNWNFTLSQDTADQSYAFNAIITGSADEYAQAAGTNDLGEYTKIFGVKFYYYTYLDDEGNTIFTSRTNYDAQSNGEWTKNHITRHRSLIQITLDKDTIEKLLYNTSITYVLDQTLIPDQGELKIFSKDDNHTILYSEIETEIDKSATNLGYSSKAFSDNYNGFMTINNTEYFVVIRYVKGYYAGIFTPTKNIYSTRTVLSIIVTTAAFIYLLIRSGAFTIHDQTMEDAYSAIKADNRAITSGTVEITMANGRKKKVKTVTSRWDDARTPWKYKDSGEKFLTIVRFTFVIFAAMIIIAFLVVRQQNPNNLLDYCLSDCWDLGWSIFAILKTVIVFVGVIIISNILRLITQIVSNSLGTRIETIVNLFISICKYVIIIAGILYCLYLYGFDSTSLLASAGILSIVIGLGAQSLIADILAGIFLAIEGEFRVGDIVTIGSFRGQVIDIGLRTTKVMDTVQNIMVYRNTDVTSVLNMTKSYSVAATTVSIDYDEDLERVEEILKKELPALKSQLPDIIDGPFYMGVKEMAASSIDLLIITYCNEQHRIPLERAINRAIFLLFKKNNVNIPFNQICVSHRGDDTQHVYMSKEDTHTSSPKTDEDNHPSSEEKPSSTQEEQTLSNTKKK